MKKTVSSILALLLIFALALGMTACGGKDEPESTETTESTTEAPFDPNAGFGDDDDTTDPIDDSSEVPVDGTESSDPSDPSGETETDTTTGADGSTATTASTAAGKPTYANQLPLWQSGAAVDPTTYDKNLQLQYFVWCANNVREKKPGFLFRRQLKITDVETTLLGGMVDGIVNAVVADLMPGDWEDMPVDKGKANNGKWMSGSEKTAVFLTPSDISSISVSKSGANYVITVKLPTEKDPAKPAGQSKYSKVHEIEDAKGILEQITGSNNAISGDANKTTLTYKNGYSIITVNAKSQVIGMEGGFEVDAFSEGMKVTLLTGDLTAKQVSKVEASKFVW